MTLHNPPAPAGPRLLQATVPRYIPLATIAGVITSGGMRLAYFTAGASVAVSKVRAVTGSTAAGATPTLCRLGLYAEADNGDLALVGSTANDTALFAGASTFYERSLTTPVLLTQGGRYAVGVLMVTAAAAPTFRGANGTDAAEMGLAERQCGFVAGQADLPSSVLAASISDSTQLYYFAVRP